jgi:ketosteroid isomerase-like protein
MADRHSYFASGMLLTPTRAGHPFKLSPRGSSAGGIDPLASGDAQTRIGFLDGKQNPRKETMKIRLLLTLAGFASSFAVPTFAQQTKTPDPQVTQQRDLRGDPNALAEFNTLGLKVDEAFNKNDAVALAALFTEDAVLVAPDGMFFGRKAIQKRYVDNFRRSPVTTSSGQGSCLHAIDNAMWSTGQWWTTRQGQAGPKFEQGFWSAIYVRDGDAWKIRLFTISDAPQFIAGNP